MSLGDVYASHAEAVRALARRQLGDAADADDLTAATFSTLMDIEGPHRRGAREPEVRSFALAVCANLIKRFRRARARRSVVHEIFASEAPGAVDNLERRIVHRQLAERLAGSLESLPEEQRTALLLSALEDHSAADIARLTGVPEATVRTRLFHARRKLRKALEPPTRARRRLLVGAGLALSIALVALGPRAMAAPFVATYHAVLRAVGLDARPGESTAPREPAAPRKSPPRVSPPNISPPNISPPNISPPSVSPPNISPPSVSPPNISPPNISPPGISPSRASRPLDEKTAPVKHDMAPVRSPVRAVASTPKSRPRVVLDPFHAEYLRGHEAQFVAHDYEAALRAWDVYLGQASSGSFALEARYNRAIALAQLGRLAEAREALAPFAAGEHGDYRRRAAQRLLDLLPPQ
jgi:RNA polymerase sigma-70 factor (ECF subfamily)